jgi:hypothetical protein
VVIGKYVPSSKQSVSSMPLTRTAASVSGTSSRIDAARSAISSAAFAIARSVGMHASRNADSALAKTQAAAAATHRIAGDAAIAAATAADDGSMGFRGSALNDGGVSGVSVATPMTAITECVLGGRGNESAGFFIEPLACCSFSKSD